MNHQIEIYVKDGKEGFYGKEYSVDEVLKEVLKDKIFYEDNGGVTFSGGEALLYAKELLPLMEQIKQNNISIAVESSLSNHQVILRWRYLSLITFMWI